MWCPKRRRAAGDHVWVQHIEAESKEWFECEITEVHRHPITEALEYRLKLVDGGAPGTDYEKGILLPAHRLRDENDRRR